MVLADIDPTAVKDLFYVLGKNNGNTGNFYCSGAEGRGPNVHPSHCWRAKNAQLEMEKHKNQYKGFLKLRRKNFVSSPSLAEVQAEIAPGIKMRPQLEKRKTTDGAAIALPK